MYCRSLTSVTIPDSVTSIGKYAFRECGSLASVTLSNNITSINSHTFASCESLTNVTIPDGVTSIDENAFSWCDSMTSVTIPDSVTSIGEEAFLLCGSLTSVTIGNSVADIGEDAFHQCKSLANVTLGNSVTNIGDYAFSWCDSLTSVTMPDSVTSIGKNAFSYCKSLARVRIGKNLTNIGELAFYNSPSLTSFEVAPDNETFCSQDDVLFNKSKTKLVQYPVGKPDATYIIPDSVTSIGAKAFAYCSSMTSMTIPDRVTEIETEAFSYCVNLVSVTIPNSVTHVGDGAFYTCKALKSVIIPSSVTSIGEKAFGFRKTDAQIEKCASTADNIEPDLFETKSTTYYADPVEGFVIYGYNGTAAQHYADENNITFVALRDLPVITSQPQSARVGVGKTAHLSVVADGENLSYQWQFKKSGATSWTKWSGKVTAAISFKFTESNNGTQYRCVVTNEAGSVTSEAATLTILPQPVITSQPESVSVVLGKTVILTVAATGENLSYQWQFKKAGATDWRKWTGKTSATLSFKSTAANDGTQYRCVITNEAGSVTSDAATMTVSDPN